VACDVAGIRAALADRPDIALIEDNAHGLFGRWRGEPLGSLGRFATLSFHETKNIVCGEGGALLINDSADIDRARVLYDKGTNRQAFFRGQVDKYSWKDVGSSFGLADTLAAYLYGQLEQREVIQAKRRAVFERYQSLLAPHSSELGLRLPVIPDDVESAYHMFYVLLPDPTSRDRVLELLRAQRIHPTFHYVPLHSSDAGRRFAARESDCPVTVDVSNRLIRLPFYNNLTLDDIHRVVAALLVAASSEAA
jgi:dTDP-4-amino-4,6-dideoxygalactose transaminase